MDEGDVARAFEQSGALLNGHFLLTSGLHSERYLQCALVLQWPKHAQALGEAIASRFLALGPDVVVSPAIGGIIIGYEVGRALGCRSIFAERESGWLRLRRGFSLKPHERVVVVEDVLTTGGSTLETIKLAKAHGGLVLGAASIVDRSGGQVSLETQYHSLWTLSVPTYKPEECPLCRLGSLPVKPGSRSHV